MSAFFEDKMEQKQQSESGEFIGQPFLPEPTSKEPPSAPTDSSTNFNNKETLPKAHNSKIKYRFEYRDSEDSLIHSDNIDKHDFDVNNRPHEHVFEIVATYRTANSKFKSKNSSDKDDEKQVPLVTDSRKKVKMIIHSQAIIYALRSVVKYYPGQELLGDSISIPEPYPVLVHHERELREFRERCNPSKQTNPLCPKERDAYEHLKILEDFLEETVMSAVRTERERNEKGKWTFDMLWLKMKPGTTWNVRLEGSNVDNWTQCVVESLEDGFFSMENKPWLVRFWYMDFDGKWIGRCRDNYTRPRFDGEEPTNEFYKHIDEKEFEDPPESEDAPEKNSEVADLVAQGKKFFDLLRGKCQYHNGTTSHFPFRKVEGLAMVDMKSYYLIYVSPKVSHSSEDNSWVSDCLCSVCKARKERTPKESATDYSRYDGLIMDTVESLSAHQYFLLPKTVRAYVFKTRDWERLRIENLSEPNFQPQMMDTLVMDPARLQVIKALAGSYIRENKHKEKSSLPPWNADFVEGKGQGQIFLLHGKPGVGKTYTAECIAQYTKRPLMVVTSSDIGTKPEEIEQILLTKFKQAASWGAILLIDEADVFMEQRSTNDLNRNSLVAGFLRALEFYEGILFLTTNRVGTFDDAFISRIHVKLYYPEFTDGERQQIWKTFMDKLIQDRGKFIRVSLDAKEYIKGSKIKEVKWNGREIRNAFQTAVALAEYEADKDEEGKIMLKDTHLSAIVEMSQDFKKYLEDLHRADEDKRALQQGLRINQER